MRQKKKAMQRERNWEGEKIQWFLTTS